MNKKLSFWFKVLCATFCVVIVLIFMAGCQKSVDISQYMSDFRSCMYAGEGENVFVTVVSGTRENPYKYDGIKNNCVDFCIVSLFPSSNLEANELDVSLFVGETEHSIILEKSPYENGYMADLGSMVSAGQQVMIRCEDINCEIELNNISQNWEITCSDALKIGVQSLNNKIQENMKDGKLDGECYLKIIYDKSREIKTYYWYFTFVSGKGDVSSCVIDTMSGLVLAKI